MIKVMSSASCPAVSVRLGIINDPVPLIEKSRASCASGKFPGVS